MSLPTVALLALTFLGGAPDSTNENFSITTAGQSILWESPSIIAADGSHYEMLYTINSALVLVSYGGFEFGPYDVTDMIPPDLIVTWQPSEGPVPLDFMWHEVVTPADANPPSLAYDWIVEIDENGTITILPENPRRNTNAQRYAMNEILNNRTNTHNEKISPYSSTDVIGVIPIKKNIRLHPSWFLSKLWRVFSAQITLEVIEKTHRRLIERKTL